MMIISCISSSKFSLFPQVIDGFQVKRTKDSKETVAFLTVMTRYLQSSFRVTTIDYFKPHKETTGLWGFQPV